MAASTTAAAKMAMAAPPRLDPAFSAASSPASGVVVEVVELVEDVVVDESPVAYASGLMPPRELAGAVVVVAPLARAVVVVAGLAVVAVGALVVGGEVEGGDDEPCTTTDPFIVGCIEHRYSSVAGTEKVREYDSPWDSGGDVGVPSGHATVCS